MAGTSDEALISIAEEDYREDRWLEAARILAKVKNKSLLTEQHSKLIQQAVTLEQYVQDLKSEPGDDWTKQGEKHGRWDTLIWYKVDERNKLTARLETPIEEELLVPLLSVLNESSLYTTWMPSWKKPFTLGVRTSDILRQTGRFNQLIRVVTDVPWPMAPRETIMNAFAVDDIDENGAIVASIGNCEDSDPDVPPIEAGIVRIDFEGGFLFRKCPSFHPAFLKSKHRIEKDVILVCTTISVDAKVNFVPEAIINFVTRTVLSKLWEKLLLVAEDVRQGKRPQHAATIQEKRELYDWVGERISVLLSRQLDDDENSKYSAENELEHHAKEERTGR